MLLGNVRLDDAAVGIDNDQCARGPVNDETAIGPCSLVPPLSIREWARQNVAKGRLNRLDEDVLVLESRQIGISVQVLSEILER